MSDSSSDEDVPLAALSNPRRQSKTPVKYNEDTDEEEEFQDVEEEVPEEDDGMDTDTFIVDTDSDEDQPLSSLKSPKAKSKPPTKKTSTKKAKKPTPQKKDTSSKKKTTKVTKSKSTISSAPTKSGSSYNAPSIELYTNCDKGKLIQSLLVRWWYAYSWPDIDSLPKSTPKNYTALDGFTGVYICTAGSDVGAFKDYRNHETAPNFRNFARKSAEELKVMLLTAIENQRKALRKIEGEGTKTEKDLTVLEKWANKLNCAKADKEAEKVLKAARLSLS